MKRPRRLCTEIQADGTVDTISDNEWEENISRERAVAQDDLLDECQNEMEATSSRKRQPLRLGHLLVSQNVDLPEWANLPGETIEGFKPAA